MKFPYRGKDDRRNDATTTYGLSFCQPNESVALQLTARPSSNRLEELGQTQS
jgi:hypothetical protein